MKPIHLLPLLLCPLALTACHDDDNDNESGRNPAALIILESNFDTPNISYSTDGVWNQVNENKNLETLDFDFHHYLNEYGMVEGFVASKNSDTGYFDPMYLHPYTVVGGQGLVPGQGYAVGFWSSREGEAIDERACWVKPNLTDSFLPTEVWLNNTTYAWYTMTQGDAFTRPFTQGDWFKVVIHGVQAPEGGNEGPATETTAEKTVEFYLADCREGENPQQGIVSQWTKVDLSSLGIVSALYFTMESSDSGAWGMNTPAYFALSGLKGLVEVTAE